MSISIPGGRLATRRAFQLSGLLRRMSRWRDTEAASDEAPDHRHRLARTRKTSTTRLWSTTVFTREDIEARQPSSVQELLASIAGIDIGNNGGLGKLSSVFIRGAESDHTLVLVDGVRVASATAGTAAIDCIPVEQIERIEIVRGPRSTLYGTDAIGGVIQIFTRRAPQAMAFPSAPKWAAGSTTRAGSAPISRRVANARGSASGAESYRHQRLQFLRMSRRGSRRRRVLRERAGRGRLSQQLGLAVRGLCVQRRLESAGRTRSIADGRTEFDGSIFAGNETEFTQKVLSLSLDGALGRRWHTRVALGRSEDHQDNFFHDTTGTVPPAPSTRTATRRACSSMARSAKRWRLITGVEQPARRDRQRHGLRRRFAQHHGRLR